MKNSIPFDGLQQFFENQADQKQSQIFIGYYVNLVLRRRWFVIIPLFFALLAGIYLAVALPKKYQAETLILIEPQSVPDNDAQPIVASGLESRIATIKEMILSRTNLLKVIENLNIFDGPEYAGMLLDEKIESMRKHTTVEILSDRRSHTENVFKITFEAEEPHEAMQVANAMADRVIEQNLKVRESRVVGSVEIPENQLVTVRRSLKEVEAALKDFRENHKGELPEQLHSNVEMLERLKQQLSNKQKIQGIENKRLISLESQIELARNKVAMIPKAPALQENRESITLKALRKQLADYKTRYTLQHPDVIRLERKIEELEKENPSLLSKTDGGGSNRMGGGVGLSDLIAKRNGVERKTASIKEEVSALQDQIAIYQRRVENTPVLEQQLLSLRNEYENTRKTYDSLLARKQEAEMAAKMERQQKGEQFRILDPARLPAKPQSPDMRELFLMCLMAGLGLGGGLIFLMEFLDKTLKKLESVPKKLGIPLLVVVPRIDHDADGHKHRINDGLSIAAAVICMALMALFAAVSVLGMPGPTEMVKRMIT